MANISNIYVPSEGNPKSKLWIVGESPGYHEEVESRPFVGESGKLLDTVLVNNGIRRSDIFITNLCHYRPPGNKFQALLGSRQLEEGLDELKSHMADHRPNLICGLGGAALFHLTGAEGISKYRGSILTESTQGIKCISTYHPAFILRNRAAYPIFDVDIRRVASDSRFPELNLPQRTIVIDPPELDYWLNEILKHEYVSCDIESVKGTTEILCVGFGLSAELGVVIPYDGTLAKRDFIETVLASNVRKVFHFGTYDVTVLRLNGHTVNAYTDDTIVQAHVLNPELPRDLGFLVSVETREPYFKEDGKKNIPGDNKAWSKRRNKADLYAYNGKDICTTIEIFYKQHELLVEDSMYDFYRYEMDVQNEVALPLSMNGFPVDLERLNSIADYVRKDRAKYIIFLQTLVGRSVNVGSTKQMCYLLYQDLKLPVRKKTNKKTGKVGLTADEDAIVSLIGYCKNHLAKLKTERATPEWTRKLHILKLILKIRGYDKLDSSYFKITLNDGKAMSLYKVAGTETGRFATSKFVDGSGLNISTIPREALEIE